MNNFDCILLNIGMPRIPIGLRLMKELLNNNQIQTEIYSKFENDENLFTNVFESIKNEKQIKIIGASIHWYPQIIPTLKFLEIIKIVRPEIAIVLGGITTSCYAKDLIKFKYIDYIITGAGEIPFLNLSKKILNIEKIELSAISNLVWKEDNVVIEATHHYFSNDKDIELCETTIDPKDHENTGHVIYMGKGCVGNCLNCGGGNKAFKTWNNDGGVYIRDYKETYLSIKKILKSSDYIYLVHDFNGKSTNLKKIFNDVSLDDARLFKNKSITIDSWGLPEFEAIQKIDKLFNEVSLEMSPEVGDENIRKESRHFFFSNEELEQLIISCQSLNNVNISLFFGYPYSSNFTDFEFSTRNCIFYLIKKFDYLFFNSSKLRITFAPLCSVVNSPISIKNDDNVINKFDNYYQLLSSYKRSPGSLTYIADRLRYDDFLKMHYALQIESTLQKSYCYIVFMQKFKKFNEYNLIFCETINNIWDVLRVNPINDNFSLWNSLGSGLGYFYDDNQINVKIPNSILTIFLKKLITVSKIEQGIEYECLIYLIKGFDGLDLKEKQNIKYSTYFKYNEYKLLANNDIVYPQKNVHVNSFFCNYNIPVLNRLSLSRIFGFISFKEFSLIIDEICFFKNKEISTALNSYFPSDVDFKKDKYQIWFEIKAGNEKYALGVLYYYFYLRIDDVITILDSLGIVHEKGIIECETLNLNQIKFGELFDASKTIHKLYFTYLLCEYNISSKYKLLNHIIKKTIDKYFIIFNNYSKSSLVTAICFLGNEEFEILSMCKGLNSKQDILNKFFQSDSEYFSNLINFLYSHEVII